MYLQSQHLQHYLLLQKYYRDAAPSSTKISDVNVKTVMGVKITICCRWCIEKVDQRRFRCNQRIEWNIQLIISISSLTQRYQEVEQDADMAAESIRLTKGRILQQAAT